MLTLHGKQSSSNKVFGLIAGLLDWPPRREFPLRLSKG